MSSFWGGPQLKPIDRDVAKHLASIRELTEDKGDKRSLQIATSALHAIIAFIVDRFGPKEALSLLDTLRSDLIGATP